MVEDLSAQAHRRRRQRIDRDLEREDDRAIRISSDQRRGAAGRPVQGRRALEDEVPSHELADEAADGAAGKTGPGDEVRARQRSAGMKLADDGAQVGAPDGLAAVSELVATDEHGFVFLFLKCAVRDSYKHAAMSIRMS